MNKLLQETISSYLNKREELVNYLGVHENYISVAVTDGTDEEWMWDDADRLSIAGEVNTGITEIVRTWEQVTHTVFEMKNMVGDRWFIILANDMRVLS